MNDFSQDLYARLTDITEQQAPCILNIGAISQAGSNVTIGAGAFRFADAHYAFLPYDTGIFGNAPSETIAVTGNGFVVARYSIMPTSANQTNYTFLTQYLFVASVNPITDVVVAVITSGVISGYGTYLNYYPDIQDDTFTNTVSITGVGGLSVPNGTTSVTDFLSSYTSMGITSSISNNSLNSTIMSENNSLGNYAQLIVAGGSSNSVVQSNAYTAGVLQYTMNVENDRRPSIAVSGTGSTSGVPTSDDIVVGQNLPKTQAFTVNDSAGNTWALTCIDLAGGGFPSDNFLISGNCGYGYAASTSSRTIDLVGAGIGVSGGVSIGAVTSLQNPTLAGNFTNFVIAVSRSVVIIDTIAAMGGTIGVTFFGIVY
jgi:hypothetical protein